MRTHPRNFSLKKYDLYMYELSPLYYDLVLYHDKTISFLDLLQRTRSHIMKDGKAQQQLKALKKLHLAGMTVTLLCVEPEGEDCHRHLIASMIKNYPEDESTNE